MKPIATFAFPLGIQNLRGHQSLGCILGLSLSFSFPRDALQPAPIISCLHFPGHRASRLRETRIPFFPLRKTIRPALSNHQKDIFSSWQKCNVQNVIILALKFLTAPFNMKLWLMDVLGGSRKTQPMSLPAVGVLCSECRHQRWQ